MAPVIVNKHIVIAGAGLAGLSFAHALSKFWTSDHTRPTITIYERGKRAMSPKREGYSLGIRSDKHSGGMQALQKLGMLEELLPLSLNGLSGEAATSKAWNTSWETLFELGKSRKPPSDLPVEKTRFTRYALRRYLIDTLPHSVEVRWSTGCVSAATQKNGKMEVLLGDGTTTTCDLLVAADGANSKIRECILPDDKLSFAGAVSVLGTSHFPDGVPNQITSKFGLILGADGASAFLTPMDKYSAVWTVSHRSSKVRQRSSYTDTLEQKQELMSEARHRSRAIKQPFGRILDAADLETVRLINCFDKKPVQHQRLDMPVVFIGDSNHAVCQFAGNGANMALMDGVDLALELCNASDLKQAIAAFDAKSIPRAKKSLTVSHMVIRMAHLSGIRLFLFLLLVRIMVFVSGLFS